MDGFGYKVRLSVKSTIFWNFDFLEIVFLAGTVVQKSRFGVPKIDGKSIKNQCKNDARKSDAKMMENYPKWMPKGGPKATERQTNVDPEMSKNQQKNRSQQYPLDPH